MIDDASLLRRFAEKRSEDAFSELVRRHLNLVYFAALRQTNGDTHRAEDAAQTTFTLLAQKAGSLLAHPNLAGWLHQSACLNARDLMRTEQRRLTREQAAHALHEITSASAHDEAWARIRPIIDDALSELDPDDREAVLLRYFENRSYSEIGDTLQLAENAARMRVNRALERLEGSLARRGVKSTATALAAVLTIPAALAAPVHLSTTITSTALAAPVVGATVTAFSLLKLMSTAKFFATAAGLAVLVTAGVAVYQNQQLQSALDETARLRRQQSELQSKLSLLEARLATETKRANEADADNGKLLAITASTIANPSVTPNQQIPYTQSMVMARYKNAQALAKAGQFENALKEYLWCYDTGMRQFNSLQGTRISALLQDMAKLGETYPPARLALQERRDAVAQRIQDDSSDTDAVTDFAILNQVLGDENKSLALFDTLSPDDRDRRRLLGQNISLKLLEAQRYSDLVQVKSYSSMATGFDLLANDIAKMPPERVPDYKRYVAVTTTRDIEALAGANDSEHANALINKLLALDNTADTLAIIQQHLTRAGHPELLK